MKCEYAVVAAGSGGRPFIFACSLPPEIIGFQAMTRRRPLVG
jgi:hypothetical protein